MVDLCKKQYFCTMCRINNLWILLIVPLSLISYISQGQATLFYSEIDKIIRYDTDIDMKKTPGYIIGVFDNDSTYFFSYGTKILKDKVAITKDDIFESGSVSKLFTSALISILIAEDKIDISEPVNKYLPTEYVNPRLSDLTISDLVHHQSGLPRRPLYFGKKEKSLQNPYAFYTEKDLLKFYRDYIPSGKSFEYSHTNYALLEVIIKNICGSSFQDLLQEKILSKLKMNQTFTDFPEEKLSLLTPGYDRALKKVAPWTFASFKGSEGIKTTANDMISFLKAHILMSGTSLDTILGKNLDIVSYPGLNESLSIAMGWHNFSKNKLNIYMHTGSTSGHNAFAAIVRETKTGVVIFSNSSTGTQDLGLQILRLINYNWKRVNS